MNPIESITGFIEVIRSNPAFFIPAFIIMIAVQALAIHKSAKSTGVDSSFVKGLIAFVVSIILGTAFAGILWVIQNQVEIIIPSYVDIIASLIIYGLSIKLTFKTEFSHAVMIWLFSLLLLLLWFIIFAVIMFLGFMLYGRIAG